MVQPFVCQGSTFLFCKGKWPITSPDGQSAKTPEKIKLFFSTTLDIIYLTSFIYYTWSNDDFMNDGSNSRWSNPCGPRASLLQCRLSWKVKDSKVDARRHDQCNFMNYGSKNQWSNPLWVKGQRFNSAKASGTSLLLTVNLHRHLRR